MCRPEYVLLREPFTGGYTGPPLRGVEGIPNHPGQRRTAERLRRGCEGMGGDRSRDHPKGTINAGQSLSQPAADSSLYTREPLGTGDADCRVASLLAMTVLILCHSEEAQRADVGIRSFLRWTGFGPPSRRPLRMVYRSPSNGPPYLGHGLRRPNSVPKFGASVRSSAPTESPINHPSQPARSEASAPAAARDGRESTQGPSPKGATPAATGAALSEAESAERAAGQIRSLPDDLGVQHSVQRSEVSARPRPCSRRGCVDWAGRFRAASRCARGRGASGLHNENAFFLLTAPPPFSFWGAKKKMGVESPQGMPCHHAPFGAAGPDGTPGSSCSTGAALAMVSDGPMYLGP